jgi:hypothetical protein
MKVTLDDQYIKDLQILSDDWLELIERLQNLSKRGFIECDTTLDEEYNKREDLCKIKELSNKYDTIKIDTSGTYIIYEDQKLQIVAYKSGFFIDEIMDIKTRRSLSRYLRSLFGFSNVKLIGENKFISVNV